MRGAFNRGSSGNCILLAVLTDTYLKDISYNQAEQVLSRGVPGMVAAPAAVYSMWKIYDPKVSLDFYTLTSRILER